MGTKLAGSWLIDLGIVNARIKRIPPENRASPSVIDYARVNSGWRVVHGTGKRIQICIALLAAILSGCGYGDDSRVSVGGRVTLDGKALDEGSISFIPIRATSGPVAGGMIVAGKYSIDAGKGPAIGPHRVEIRATRKTGKMVPNPGFGGEAMVEEVVEAVPTRYNSQSTLRQDLDAGTNLADFELTSN